MVNKFRRVNSVATIPQARSFSGPATMGVEFEDNIGIAVAVPNSIGDGSLFQYFPDKSRSFELFDDFLGDSLDVAWNTRVGTDTLPPSTVINVQSGGVVRMLTGNDAGTTAADAVQLEGQLNFRADRGPLVFETRIAMDVITNSYFYAGFTDQTAALQAPATLSVVTFTRNATNLAGFLFDTAATTDTIRLVGKTAAGTIDTANAWAAATFIVLRIELNESGDATFYINRAKVGTLKVAVTPATPLAPVIVACARTTSSRNLDVDYIWALQSRT